MYTGSLYDWAIPPRFVKTRSHLPYAKSFLSGKIIIKYLLKIFTWRNVVMVGIVTESRRHIRNKMETWENNKFHRNRDYRILGLRREGRKLGRSRRKLRTKRRMRIRTRHWFYVIIFQDKSWDFLFKICWLLDQQSTCFQVCQPNELRSVTLSCKECVSLLQISFCIRLPTSDHIYTYKNEI